MEEIWRDIPGWEGYKVSNKKRIRSVDRIVIKENGKTQFCPGKILTPHKDKKGYNYINLWKNSKTKRCSLYRLVALSFQDICGEYFEGAEVDHLDTDRSNDIPENLRWVDRKGQFKNKLTQKHMSESNTNNHNISKWVIKLSKNNEILHFYPSTRQANRETGIDNSSISACCLGKQKTAGGFIWKYAE